MDDFLSTSVVEVADDVRSGRTSAREQAQRALDVIAAKNDQINAFVAVDPDRALAEADAVDARLAKGDDVGPLAGVPIGVKDLENAIGYVTTMGSRLYADGPPATTDSNHVARLRAAGAVVIGKTNTPEFGAVGDTFNDVFGPTLNPHNLERSAGGSSGGSGAAIAAGMVPLATGSDGGGSIRIPSAINGLSGLKPSAGRVPLGGPEASNWLHYSTPGPMARRIADVAYTLDAVIGPHPSDPNSLPRPHESWYQATLGASLPRAVMWSPNLGYGVNDREVETVVRTAVERIASAGTEVIEVEVFDSSPIADWAGLAFLGLAAKVREWVGTPQWELLGEPVRFAAELAMENANEFTVYDSIKTGHRVNYRMAELFERAPLLLCPTMAGQTARPTRSGTVNGQETINWVEYTPPFNMTGHPAGTVLAGSTADGMPVGLQVIAPHLDDVGALSAIAAFEQVLAS